MCMNCGCHQLDERHGNDANITAEDYVAAARANDQTPDETLRNIAASVDQLNHERAGTGLAAAESPAR